MKPTATIPPQTSETLTIRIAVPADAEALGRLAQLDSAPPPARVPMLLAEVDGELRAALPIGGGPAIADPFQRTVEHVSLLSERRRQLARPPRAARRSRQRRVRRALPAPRHWAASSQRG